MKIVAVLVTVLGLAACSRTPEEPIRPASNDQPSTPTRPSTRQQTCPPDPDGPPMLPVHTLAVRESGVQFAAELVYKPADTARGLMYRTHLADDKGMLFKLQRRVQRFWMHNTCISLDMLFVDDDGTIAGILENVPPLNDESRTIGKPTTYVLELAGGAASKFGVQTGQHIEIPATIRELAAGED